MRDAAPGRFAPAERAAGAHRLAGDDLGHRAALMHGIGVHEPRHHLLVGAHVGRHHVDVRADERDQLLHVAPRHHLQLAPRERLRVDADAALGAAVRQAGDRALPAHPDRQRRDLAEIDIGGKARAALGRSERQVMLHAVAFEHGDGAVVAADRTGDGDRALRQQQAVALIDRDFEIVGDDAELLRRHIENRTAVDRHRLLPLGCSARRAYTRRRGKGGRNANGAAMPPRSPPKEAMSAATWRRTCRRYRPCRCGRPHRCCARLRCSGC